MLLYLQFCYNVVAKLLFAKPFYTLHCRVPQSFSLRHPKYSVAIINVIIVFTIIIIIIIIISYNFMPIYNTVAEPIPWA